VTNESSAFIASSKLRQTDFARRYFSNEEFGRLTPSAAGTRARIKRRGAILEAAL
jgi:hypothetical protein